jgi:hypothetical protein
MVAIDQPEEILSSVPSGHARQIRSLLYKESGDLEVIAIT